MYCWASAQTVPGCRHEVMRHTALLCSVIAACCALPAVPAGASTEHQGPRQWDMLQQYCTHCHNAEDWAGGVAFDTMTPADVGQDAKTWEAALRKLRGHLMPPPGKPQPRQKEIDGFVHWLRGTLDAPQSARWAGHVPAQRLTRTEYANAVRGMLDVDVKVDTLLPPEIEIQGFDNIAAALSVSPAFLDQYIGAARTVAALASGDARPKLANVFYPAPGGAQVSFDDGMPLGTRGGMKFRHNFPSDGEYRFNILDLDVGLYPRAAETRHTLVILVDGREVFRGDVGGPEDLALVDQKGAVGRKQIMDRFTNIPAQVKAGTHDVVVTFIQRSRAESDEYVAGRGDRFGVFGGVHVPRLLDGVQVVGPFGHTQISSTPSRRKIFICQPQSQQEELPCARRIIANLARQAFRRPIEQADVDRLVPFYQAGRKDRLAQGDPKSPPPAREEVFDAGIREALTAVLASPDFLYRAIRPDPSLKVADKQPAVQPLSDVELASRLSFFLWGQGPDDELLASAADGNLHEAKVMQAQVQRMLADPRARTLVSGFAMKWLDLDKLNSVDPDPRLFPGFSVQVRQDLSQEAELFLKSVLLGNQSVVRLLDAKYTFLNERLAHLYGVDGVFGPQFRRVQLKDSRRWGLLGKGAVLMRTSYGDRTSPVLRGAWVLSKLMGTPPSPPPPNVNTNLTPQVGDQPRTVRARLAQHRTNSSCNQCHGVIDPIGLALENFDVTGEWRDEDHQAHQRIDASSILPSGVPVNGPEQLRQQLLRRPDEFVQTLTEKMMMYALGRELDYRDMPQIRAIVHAARAQDYRLTAIVMGIVDSDSFRLQLEQHSSKPVETKVASTREIAQLSGPGN